MGKWLLVKILAKWLCTFYRYGNVIEWHRRIVNGFAEIILAKTLSEILNNSEIVFGMVLEYLYPPQTKILVGI